MEELKHYGIIGMKWGIRRYQNPDGTLTEAGKKRYLNSDGTLNDRGKKQFGSSASSGSNSSEDSDKANTSADYERAHKKEDVKTLSDQQLRDKLNRLNMERQLEQFEKPVVEKGQSKVEKVLKAAGTISQVMGTAIKMKQQINTIQKWFDDVETEKKQAASLTKSSEFVDKIVDACFPNEKKELGMWNKE